MKYTKLTKVTVESLNKDVEEEQSKFERIKTENENLIYSLAKASTRIKAKASTKSV